MSKPKHTPGKWLVQDTIKADGKINMIRVGLPDYTVATVWVWGDAALPNARLIASAPDLLDLLETIENDDGKIPLWLWTKIKLAIEKARGEE